MCRGSGLLFYLRMLQQEKCLCKALGGEKGAWLPGSGWIESRSCSRAPGLVPQRAGQDSGCCTGSFLQRRDDTAAYPPGTWDQLSAWLQPSNVAAESCHAATEVFMP